MPVATALPSTLQGFRDFHRGETIVVCGGGLSLNELRNPERFITIGVNDVGRRFDPTYLVVLNPRQQFSGDRFRHVENSRAGALFTQLELGVKHPHVVRLRLGDSGGADPGKYADRLHYTRNSPYVALQLALFMGASRIALIGVDFTDHHFFAATGRHPLSGSLGQIETEYRRVADVARRRGVEIVNWGSGSQLKAFPKGPATEWLVNEKPAAISPAPRVFFVHYNFLSCGDVFRHGLDRAAHKLGLPSEGATWDDPALEQKVARFSPDLLFVIHGRRFAQRWGQKFARRRSAVWLVDEPYEVDDTERTSRLFDTVFVNDPSTLGRHRNCHYLPVAYDPDVHQPRPFERQYEVGFIGGGNPSRESYLSTLADTGRLSYVVGGPWKSPGLARLCLASNVPPARTADLYQRTRIVLNVFRDKHHFNRKRVAAYSLNPRIYEALACGALPVSENRPEASEVFPDMPVFRSPQEAVAVVDELLKNPSRIKSLCESCQSRLPQHTYAARLQTALAAALGYSVPVKPAGEEVIAVSDTAVATQEDSKPKPARKSKQTKYAILMVVCGGLDFVRVSTLKTLQHSRSEDARLTVVDNGSRDGAERWLQMLADRGDLDLIRVDKNIGHGPGLERARAETDSEYIVTLDSDAFPLSDDWLKQLESRIVDPVLAAGIGHHRGYVHPSCLMVARKTIDRLGCTFLNEKNKASRLDVAERLSHTILDSGGKLALLERTASQRRGSASEPVFLGSEYGSIVYHQWYTTRHLISQGAQVDDVPVESFDRSLEETLNRFGGESREVTVVVGLRARMNEPERERNPRAVLERLNRQDLERWRYRIVVVEQDGQSRMRDRLGALADRWIFAPNAGAYNRAWGCNVGVCNPGPASGLLCFVDADFLVPQNFVRRGLARVAAGAKAVLPYSELLYLTPDATEEVLREPALTAKPINTTRLTGRRFRNSQGGCMFVDAQVFFEMKGFDERFEGWGAEDREFWQRLIKYKPIDNLDQTLVHLYHRRPDESGPEATRNQVLLQKIQRSDSPKDAGPIGRLDRYRRGEPSQAPIRGDWQYWEAWSNEKIERIVRSELESSEGTRSIAAAVLEQFGPAVLDVGCGPGAVFARLQARGTSTTWTGVDVTQRMLSNARRLFPAARLVRADAGNLPFGDRSFDAVLMRHVLEHLPENLMQEALRHVLRVARRLVIVDFYVKPSPDGVPETRRIGDNFLEIRWTSPDIEGPIAAAGWRVLRRHSWNEDAELWMISPAGDTESQRELDRALQLPKISIVMPTYKRKDYLLRTLQSVQQQTYSNWELLLIDNAGDLEVPVSDPRIRLYRFVEKASSSYARNRGVEMASGELVCFFDDDDLMFPSYLESFAQAFIRNPRAAMVRCGMVVTGNRVNYSYATPECCIRRQFATADWDDRGPRQDQRYFARIVSRHGWSEKAGDIRVIKEALCRACQAPKGGLRSGAY